MARFYSILIVFLLFSGGLSAQVADSWFHNYLLGTVQGQAAGSYFDITPVGGNGFVTCGYEINQATNQWVPMASRLDERGNMFWKKTYDFLGDPPFSPVFGSSSYFSNVQTTRDGGYLFTLYRPSSPPRILWLVKTDAYGDTLWTRTVADGSGSVTSPAAELSDGRIVYNQGFASGSPAQFVPDLVLLDSAGNYISNTVISALNLKSIPGIVRTPEDGVYLWGTDTLDNAVVARLSPSLQLEWSNIYYSAPSNLVGRDLTVLEDSSIVIAYSHSTTSPNVRELHIFSIEPDGSLNWQNTYDSNLQINGNLASITSPLCVRDDGNLMLNVGTTGNDYLVCLDPQGTRLWTKILPEPVPVTRYRPRASCPGPNNTVVHAGYFTSNSNTVTHLYAMSHDSLGNLQVARVEGRVFADLSMDCVQQPSEGGLPATTLRAANGTAVGWTDSLGDYHFFMGAGTTTFSPDPLSNLWGPLWGVNCPSNPDSITVSYSGVPSLDTIGGQDFAMVPTTYCPLLVVDVSTPFLRRCDTATYYVDYCNYGTEVADSPYVILVLDSALGFVQASLPSSVVGQDSYRVDLDSLAPGDCGGFTFRVGIPCNPPFFNMTHCVSAHIFPDSSCFPPDPNWNGASLSVEGECVDGDSLRFSFHNVGTDAMASPSGIWVVEDDILRSIGSLKLPVGSDSSFAIAANGSTWTVIGDQVPFHPGPSLPRISIEGCGTNNLGGISTGFVTQFAEDDMYPYLAIDCQPALAAYDPNDKRAWPSGIGVEHLIEANTEIEYMIRFQNTGTDTAFRVILTDRLPENLDMGTLVPGASSHPYTLQLLENRTMEFRFDPIVLPDSGVNEPASHGFVKFSVRQVPDLAIGERIENAASIVFDYNPAILTDTAWHTIGELEVVVSMEEPEEADWATVSVYPNPAEVDVHFDLGDHYRDVGLEVYDLSGKVVRQMAVGSSSQFVLPVDGLGVGLYLFRITSRGKVIGRGKVMVKGR